MSNAEKLFQENQEKEAKIQRLQSAQAQSGQITEETLEDLKNNYTKIVKDKDQQLDNQKELTKIQMELAEKNKEENKKLKQRIKELESDGKEKLQKCIEKAQETVLEKEKQIKKLKKKLQAAKHENISPIKPENSMLNQTQEEIVPPAIVPGLSGKIEGIDAISAVNQSEQPKNSLNKSFEYTARTVSTAGVNKYFQIVKGKVSGKHHQVTNETDQYIDQEKLEKYASEDAIQKMQDEITYLKNKINMSGSRFRVVEELEKQTRQNTVLESKLLEKDEIMKDLQRKLSQTLAAKMMKGKTVSISSSD